MKHILIAKVKEALYTIKQKLFATKPFSEVSPCSSQEFKYDLGVLEARQSILNGNFIPDQIDTFEDYPIFLHDVYVHAVIAIPPTVPGVLFRLDGAIVVNQAFLDIDKDIQLASLAHELGHLQLGHTGPQYSDPLCLVMAQEGLGPLMENEYAADAYATELGHDMIKALEFYLQFDHVAKKPLIARIDRLKQNSI